VKYNSLLVTGGCGFIGSNFIRRTLAQTNARIVNLDKLTYAGNTANVADIAGNPSYSFIHGDICDGRTVHAIIHEHAIDCIVNFAAETHVDRSIANAAPFIATNISGVQILLDEARRANVKRFLQISTDEVYGSQHDGENADEFAPLQCGSPYSASKASADLLCRAYWKTYQFPVVITRCTNNFGPFQHPEKLIPLAISRALAGNEIPVYGDGLQRRDWLYVEDHCEALLTVIEKGIDGEVYNIGTGYQRTNVEVINSLLHATGITAQLIRHVQDRPGHDRLYAVDAAKIHRLGWRQKHSFEQGIVDTVAWYRANGAWMKEILSGEYSQYFAKQYNELQGHGVLEKD